MPPGRYQLRVPERNRAIFFLDYDLEYVVGLSIKDDLRTGRRFDVDLVKFFFAAADQLGQFMRRQRWLDLVLEPMARTHVAKQHMAGLCRLV